ncbi:MAG TPA: adenylate/guanylate cyclase domain-containing protein [Usitatibacter sp.]|nr:adenylate/guanylate cyclase domain-containing protein [Usitatibacter sp.]
MRPAWERLRSSPGLKGAFLYVLAMLVVAGVGLLPEPEESPLADVDRLAFDAQMRWLRDLRPRPLANDIVLVGIDEQTEREFPEPVALWHTHFADLFHALARAHPAAVGVDVVLPERSYDSIVPGSDLTMMRGLVALNRAAPLVYAQGVASNGQLVPVQPNYRAILQDENFGVDREVLDPDNVSRRFEEPRYADGSVQPTFAGQLLRRIGRGVHTGYIDYSVGSLVRYYPLHEVVKWDDKRLDEAFAGRIVLIGSLVPSVDRWQLPVRLLPAPRKESRRERLDYTQPGVLVHLQTLRSHLGPGMLHPVSDTMRWLLCGLAALVVFSAARPGFVLLGAVVVPAAIVALGLWGIVDWQVALPVGAMVAAFWIGLITRGVFDAIEATVERMRLQSSFAGQVSPAVMREMLAGELVHGVSAELADICVLFSDVRDFTTLSENMPPHIVTTVLQRLFDRLVNAVHRFDGTVDKFIGDGMMVLFGAPRKLDDPCGQAVQCALAMMSELDQLNIEFEREGLPTLVIGIGINYGTATVGNIGSSERHNYSAIGDAVNVAARVEGLTKELGRKIVITESVVSRIGDRFHFEPLGSHKVKGHSPVNVWGIRTTRPASAPLQQGVGA